ncbi:MAG: carbohydrate kinase family protein [Candidatus Woesearchaeota archaeon]
MAKKSRHKLSSESRSKQYDVITVGSGTLDVFVDTENKIMKEKHKNSKPTEMIAYPLGSKLLIESLKFEIGGGGTNTAVAFSRMGLRTGWIGSIGSCENSDSITTKMKEEKIDFLGKKGKGRAGFSVILDSKENDRTILTYKGENNNLLFKDLKKNDISKTRWMYFCSMVGKSFMTQKRLARFAKDNGIRLAFNPSSYQAELGIQKLKNILKYTNILILNREEADSLTKKRDLKDMFSSIHSTGPNIIIITDGKRGAFCSDGINTYKVHPQKTKIKETTGAGDAFAASFLGAFIRTEDIRNALKIATVNAQSVVQDYGAKNVLLDWETLQRKEKRRPVKITEI